MILHCPECKARHIDVGEFATKVHRTHSCQSCGLTWRPAVVATVGVQFLPGFKNAESPTEVAISSLELEDKMKSVDRRLGAIEMQIGGGSRR